MPGPFAYEEQLEKINAHQPRRRMEMYNIAKKMVIWAIVIFMTRVKELEVVRLNMISLGSVSFASMLGFVFGDDS